MHTKQRTFIYFILALLLILASPLTRVTAQSTCDTVIVDGAGIFSDTSQIQKAVTELQNTGAEVRVRTMTNYGSAGSLDLYIKGIVSQCPSWQATDSGMKNNLVVFAVAMDSHDTGIFYGAQWDDPLNNNWVRISTDFMNPRFRDGDFAGGFAAGMNEVNRLLDLKIHPQAQPPVQTNPNPPVVVVQPASPPVDLSGLWRFLGYLVLTILVLGALYFGFRAFVKWNEENEKRRGARQKALLKKQQVTAGISGWREKIEGLKTDVSGLSRQVDSASLSTIQARIASADGAFNDVLREYNGLDRSAGDPSAPNLSVTEYQAIETAYNSVLQDLVKAQKTLASAQTSFDELKEAITQAPKVLQAAEIAFDKATAAAETARHQGFTVAASILDPVADLIAGTKSSMKANRPDLALKKAGDAFGLADATNKKLVALPARKAQLTKSLAALPPRIETAKATVVEGRTAFDAIDDIYPEDAWESVHGNGTEAENRINWLIAAVAHTGDLITKQDFDGAEAVLGKTDKWLSETDSYMRSILALKASLEKAQAAMQSEITGAEADVNAATTYIRAHQTDIDADIVGQLRQDVALLAKAKAEMAKTKPNPLTVVQIARQVNTTADAILAHARDDVATAERQRAKAASTVRDAKAVISKAKEYIEDHDDDVKHGAKESLSLATSYLTAAARTSDLAAQIDNAQKAEEHADTAYQKAKDDVSDAQERRRSHEDYGSSWGSSRPYSSSPSYSQPSYHPAPSWSAPSSSMGGGSTSFGSSPIGGGSVSMGHSSMGGGSTKW